MLSLFIIHMVWNSCSSSQVIQLQAFHLYDAILYNFIANYLARFLKEPWEVSRAYIVILNLTDKWGNIRKFARGNTASQWPSKKRNSGVPAPVHFSLTELSLDD